MGMADHAQIPSIFSHRSTYDTPSYSIVLCLIVVASVLPFEFGFIVELTNFAYCLSVTMEFMAFAKLQIFDGGMLCLFISFKYLVSNSLTQLLLHLSCFKPAQKLLCLAYGAAIVH